MKERPCSVQHASKFKQLGLLAADTWQEGYWALNLMDKQSLELLKSKS